MTVVDPAERCDGAHRLLALAPTSPAHRRGAAVMARQAIESSVHTAMGREDVPDLRWRTRFLVLANLFPAVDARRGHTLWSAWSQVCHYHHYDLLPAAAVIAHRIDETTAWVEDVLRALPTAPPRFRPESVSQPVRMVTP